MLIGRNLTNSRSVPPKAKGKRNREAVKPISGLDIDSLLGGEEKEKVDPNNAVPSFKRALDASQALEDIEEAAKQMGAIIQSLITDSFGDSKYAQAMECLGVMREEITNLEEPGLFNTFVRDLKKQLLAGALGGDRRDFWFKVRWTRLGLIDQKQSEVSDVTAEEADEVSHCITVLSQVLTRTSSTSQDSRWENAWIDIVILVKCTKGFMLLDNGIYRVGSSVDWWVGGCFLQLPDKHVDSSLCLQPGVQTQGLHGNRGWLQLTLTRESHKNMFSFYLSRLVVPRI